MEHPTYRDQFIERYDQLVTATLAPERTLALLETAAAEIASEIPRHEQRWQHNGDVSWEVRLDQLSEFMEQRPQIVLEQIVAALDEAATDR
jgi:hypothetical protein